MRTPLNSNVSVMTWIFTSCILVSILAAIYMYFILIQMELSQQTSSSSLLLNEDNNKLELTEEDDANNNNANTSPSSSTTMQTNPKKKNVRKIHTDRKLMLIGTVLTLGLLTYLLLVVPNNSKHLDWLAWIGLGTIYCIVLWYQIGCEIRQNRYDRLLSIITIMLLWSMVLNLATYANQKRNQGYIYKGPARIIGYDYDSYKSKPDDTTTRTDLQVAWGGTWGCPHNTLSNTFCQGTVKGALCESDQKDSTSTTSSSSYGDSSSSVSSSATTTSTTTGNNKRNSGGGGGKKKHHRRTTSITTTTTTVKTSSSSNWHIIGNGASNSTNKTSTTTTGSNTKNITKEEQLQQELNDEIKKNQQLQKENQQLQQQNKNYTKQVHDYQNETSSLENQIMKDQENSNIIYAYDDTLFDNNYWNQQDWNAIWGSYSCYDLFDMASEQIGQTYDAEQVPGEDGWPYLNIYGNCQTCEAYIVDYYSTEHFQNMEDYKYMARNYGIAMGICALITMILSIQQQYYRTTNDNEIGFLANNNTIMISENNQGTGGGGGMILMSDDTDEEQNHQLRGTIA